MLEISDLATVFSNTADTYDNSIGLIGFRWADLSATARSRLSAGKANQFTTRGINTGVNN